MEDLDPAKKQYLIFSAVTSFFLSIAINFIFLGGVSGPLFSGFPVALAGLEGIAYFGGQIINTLILTALFTIPIYYGFMWMINRGRY